MRELYIDPESNSRLQTFNGTFTIISESGKTQQHRNQ